MLHLLFLRICHRTKNIHHSTPRALSRHTLSSLFSGALLISMLVISTFACTLSHAESNVAGEEITIFADDTFRPAPRDLGDTDSSASLSGDLFEGQLNDDPDSVSIVNDDLWQRIKDGYAMPDSTSDLIARHESWYSSRPDYIRRMVERSQKYLFHIVEEVEKRGMPSEIALLPMIESAYNPQAYSSGRASGIWQFIPSTGKHFGLKQNWWVDNRRNVTFATDAALTYLQKLHAMFGAWDLALAAYNAGEGTVGRAIERNRKLGLPTDYESLNLPPETKNYVPKLQAIKNLMTNPGNYGLKIQTIANTPYFSKVTAPTQIDAHLAAKLAEISDDEFLALNPSYNRPVITNSGDKHELLLPISSARTFRSNLATYDKPLVSWRTYYAKRGELMDKIATKFGIKVAQLRDVNDLPAQKKIKTSSTILVPNGNRTEFTSVKATATKAAEALPSIEPDNDVSTEQGSANIDIASTENNAANNNVETEPAKTSSVTHKVKKGEAMLAIAKHYGVSVKQIMTSNSLKNNRVTAGQLLTIKTLEIKPIEPNKATKTASNNKKHIAKNKTYIVKRGDTLHSIAEKFDVAIIDIRRWNKITNSHIQPGHKLTIMQPDAA